jgi:glycosyltransferase involved in cell wall biosynthesis
LQADDKIAIFTSFSGRGGVERMIVNLCRGLVEQGRAVDLVLVKSHSEHLDSLPESVNLVRLGTRHTLGSVFALARYLKRERPVAVLAAKDRAGRVALLARRLSGARCRLVLRIGTTVSAALEGRSLLRRWLWYLPMRLIYPHFDAIVAVSQGVANDLQAITGLAAERFTVIRNPVVTPELLMMSEQPVDHPWFNDGGAPIIMGMGRLTRQKDFPTLLKAFAEVVGESDCRLMIIGEGRDRQPLRNLADELGVTEAVALVGFQSNPYSYLRHAGLFVLSSAWEGSPNALTEAMALGLPVVSTDCPSGPREVLAGGRIAPLVPVGDVEALSEAIRSVLESPAEAARMRQAVDAFNIASSSRQYLALLLGHPE